MFYLQIVFLFDAYLMVKLHVHDLSLDFFPASIAIILDQYEDKFCFQALKQCTVTLIIAQPLETGAAAPR